MASGPLRITRQELSTTLLDEMTDELDRAVEMHFEDNVNASTFIIDGVTNELNQSITNSCL